MEIVEDTSARLPDLLDEDRIDVAMSQQREPAARRGLDASIGEIALQRQAHSRPRCVRDRSRAALAARWRWPLLRQCDLLAGAFRVRRELGTQVLQLQLKRLDLTGSRLVTRRRGRVGLALGLQFAL
uniref:hypothetical protein n=1 Tax=Cupriavidus ulmosensis TaxID=3065913 RepID=UPI00296B0547|nr:hypothetical protein [Cupriavidus sp. CV2]